MYNTAGIWLIYAGVVLRLLVRYAGLPQLGLVALLLALYGLLLFIEPWLVEGRPFPPFARSRASTEEPGVGPPAEGDPLPQNRWLPALYLAVQTALVVALFSVPPHVDFAAGLFIPLSLQAVLFFGRRLGFRCIALFPLVMFFPLTFNNKGWPFALIMSCFAGGICLLVGSYADQVQKAESARSHNRRLLADLQVAYGQLQGYAAQVDDLAAEQERSRLARELHDSVTQTVFSMNLTVKSARLLLARDRARAAAQLVRLEELAAGAMGEIQTLVSQLRPTSAASLAADGLPQALRHLAVERHFRDGLQVTLEVTGDRALPDAVASGLYRIVQEALANVAKHAGTSEVTVHLDLAAEPAWLQIEDRGHGFEPHAALSQAGHLGLAGMTERARESGWHLSIDSGAGLGTRIRLEEGLQGGRR